MNRAVPGSSADCRSTVAGVFGPLAIGGEPPSFFLHQLDPVVVCSGTYSNCKPLILEMSDTRGHSAAGLAADGR